jgi:hypothetical protein
MAGHIQDRWYKTETTAAGKAVRLKTDRHGTGLRYRARYVGPDGTEKYKSFPDGQKRVAEKWLSGIEADMSRGQYFDPRRTRHSAAARRTMVGLVDHGPGDLRKHRTAHPSARPASSGQPLT